MIMEVEWKKGRPEKDGKYLVIVNGTYFTSLGFTTIWGWNSSPYTKDDNCVFKDEEITMWSEITPEEVIDKYGIS